MQRIAIYLAFLVLAIGGGLLLGASNMPGEWYASLNKPFFNPPSWLFGPVWTVLYVLIAIAGARTWMANARGLGMQLWFGQMALNFMWSPAFFGYRMPGVALVVVLAMLAVILAFIADRWNRDRIAALLFAPYAAWVAFASLLNAAIVWLN